MVFRFESHKDRNMSNSQPIATDRLRSFVERIELLDRERYAIVSDTKGVYSEAKSAGFDTKTLRKVVKERRIEPDDRSEQLALFDLYWHALTGQTVTPLEKAAEAA